MSHHHRRDSGGDVVHVIPTNNPPPENWFPNLGDSAVWATEDDYNRVWAVNPDNSPGDNGPPNKKTRGSPSSSSATTTSATAASNRTKAIGKMFFKTKLCCKFRAGTCPYITNCNFAHTVEELRRPPPNWQEIVAAHEEERSGAGGTPTVAAAVAEPREEFQIPSLVSSTAESGRSFKGRHCKKFYTEEGCPYGESCTFMHDETSRNRESVAISLGPGGGYGGGGGNGGGSGGAGSNVVVLGGGGVGGSGSGSGSGIQIVKPSNWKTRICNKWEITGYCPFGAKCHFAHGAAELHRFGGGLIEEGEGKDGVSPNPEVKQTGPNPKGQSSDSTTLPSPGVPHLVDAGYSNGIALQRASSAVTQKPGIRTHQKWKGPAKISRIYGDWIDDIE
uniref:Zinc finger CCCH domain-containing protein 12 n=1 Tax=Noccaea caerulescens TaxID=107243 RepID=A0A1J3I998_NOCCA